MGWLTISPSQRFKPSRSSMGNKRRPDIWMYKHTCLNRNCGCFTVYGECQEYGWSFENLQGKLELVLHEAYPSSYQEKHEKHECDFITGVRSIHQRSSITAPEQTNEMFRRSMKLSDGTKSWIMLARQALGPPPFPLPFHTAKIETHWERSTDIRDPFKQPVTIRASVTCSCSSCKFSDHHTSTKTK